MSGKRKKGILSSSEEEQIKEMHGLFYTKKEPRKTMNTFLRNQNKLLVSGSVISDRKAMILIRLNSTIVSGTIVFHEYLDTNVPLGSAISAIIVIGMTLSLVLAILSAKPFSKRFERIFKNEITPLYPKLSQNSFLVLQNVSLVDYEIAMDEVVNSQELQLGNQVRAHYLMNRNLVINIRFLDLAYTIFLSTFILVAITFLVGRFII